ncbi:unnamed protein product [Caenorhabditis angaria]|uniref:Uncharacterized protein n=1 Tax=Caenorhabditis angaria TaxID=860376 RepID=A0A9P1ID16_9PELO|nr:unnamed protein product [Caenorhabditis angaria]
MLFNIKSLLVLVLSVAFSVAFVLQDLPLERFERSSSFELSPANSFERQNRANMLFRPYLGQYAKYLQHIQQQ